MTSCANLPLNDKTPDAMSRVLKFGSINLTGLIPNISKFLPIFPLLSSTTRKVSRKILAGIECVVKRKAPRLTGVGNPILPHWTQKPAAINGGDKRHFLAWSLITGSFSSLKN